MDNWSTTRSVWKPTKGGLLVPRGTLTQTQSSYSEKLLTLKSKAEEIEELFNSFNIAIPCGCDLSKLIANIKQCSDLRFIKNTKEFTEEQIINNLYFSRLVEPVLTLLRPQDNKKEYLKRLTSGSLNLLKREKSQAKDILWELELLHMLRMHNTDAYLKEPPDIIVNFEERKIGIACKKVYSEKHVEKTLSNAIAQIEDTFEYGIVAINIDELVPEDLIISAPNESEAYKQFSHFNYDFIERNERYFLKYIPSGRILAVHVSTSIIANLYASEVQNNNIRHCTYWHDTNIAPKKAQVYRKFFNAMAP